LQGRQSYYTPRPRPRRPPSAPPTLGQMVWVPPCHLKFGEGSGHQDRPAYSVTPGGRGMLFIVLPCTSRDPGPTDRFYELWSIHYRTRVDRQGNDVPDGDRPWSVYSRTWIFECAEKLDFNVTGPLATYVRLTKGAMNKPCEWWRERVTRQC